MILLALALLIAAWVFTEPIFTTLNIAPTTANVYAFYGIVLVASIAGPVIGLALIGFIGGSRTRRGP